MKYLPICYFGPVLEHDNHGDNAVGNPAGQKEDVHQQNQSQSYPVSFQRPPSGFPAHRPTHFANFDASHNRGQKYG